MKNIIQFTIEKGEDGHYTASAIGHFIVTQGKTFEELLENINEATELYLEEEDLKGCLGSGTFFNQKVWCNNHEAAGASHSPLSACCVNVKKLMQKS